MRFGCLCAMKSTAFTLLVSWWSFIKLLTNTDSRCQSQNCEKCGQERSGHYLQPMEQIEHVRQNGYGDCQFKPPESVIEEGSKDKAKKNAIFTNEELLAFAENCCLPVSDVPMWVEHVNDIDSCVQIFNSVACVPLRLPTLNKEARQAFGKYLNTNLHHNQ